MAIRADVRKVQIFDEGYFLLLQRPDRLHDEVIVGSVVVVPILSVIWGSVLYAERDLALLVDVAFDFKAARKLKSTSTSYVV